MSWTTIGVLWVIAAGLVTIILSRMFGLAEKPKVFIGDKEIGNREDTVLNPSYTRTQDGVEIYSCDKTCPACKSTMKVVLVLENNPKEA